MNQSIRVAVIEIGSRAVRLLVADVFSELRLQVVATDWKETGLAEGLDIGGSEANNRINQVIEAVRRFHAKARELKPVRTAAFGTEAIRKFDHQSIARLREACPDFRVLTRKEEAELSFVTAATGVMERDASKQSLLVVDQGSGSMEVIVGYISGVQVRIEDSRSYKLGTRELVKLLQKNGGLPGLRKFLAARFSDYKPIKRSFAARPIILGSAATKLAWIKVRPDDTARYDPRQVQDCLVTLDDIALLMRIAEGDEITARRLIDPRNPQSGEFETVVAGLVALEVFLQREEKRDFTVCAHGTRYGFAEKLALEKGSESFSRLNIEGKERDG